MDTQENKYEYGYEKEPANMSERMHKDAMRYRRLKFFLDDLVVMDRKRGALHFADGDDLDNYLDNLNLGTSILTPASITAHALKILENELKMTSEEK